MAVLVTLRPVSLKGQVIPPGTRIRLEDGQELVSKGYARELAKDECREILDEWAEETKRVLGSVTLVDIEDVFMPDGRHCIKVTPVSEGTGERRSVSSRNKAKNLVKKAWENGGLFEK